MSAYCTADHTNFFITSEEVVEVEGLSVRGYKPVAVGVSFPRELSEGYMSEAHLNLDITVGDFAIITSVTPRIGINPLRALIRQAIRCADVRAATSLDRWFDSTFIEALHDSAFDAFRRAEDSIALKTRV